MIGKTNCKAAQTLPCEFINISLLSNQSSHGDLIGATFTVSYGRFSKDYVWDGNEVTVEIPAYVQYTVSFGAVDGYKSPESVTNTAVVGNSRSISATYRTCVLSVTLADNQSGYNDISGAKANVVGASVNASLSSGGSVKVPMGESVTITGTGVSGYSTPSTTYTADAASKSIMLTYCTEILTVGTNGVANCTIYVKKSNGTILGSQTTESQTYKIPSGTQYYVEGSAVDGYFTPETSPIYTASSSNDAKRSVWVVYKRTTEHLIVQVLGVSSEYTAYVINASTGAIIGSQTTQRGEYYIDGGTQYYIQCSDVAGYVTPSKSSVYTAVADLSTSVIMQYTAHPGTLNPTNGVYIQDTDGYFHTEAEWDGTYEADCVAVITDACRFGIALTEASSAMQIHNNSSGALENYMTAISNETQAKADYNGATNTANIMKLQSGTGYAAGWCNAYTFPSGKNGFLPAHGQLWSAYNNKSAVDAALVKAGGTTFASNLYWSSTFQMKASGGDRRCWHLRWTDGKTSDSYMDYIITKSLYIRPFCSI